MHLMEPSLKSLSLLYFELVRHSTFMLHLGLTYICSETRRTYRAVLSEPTVVIPEGYAPPHPEQIENTEIPKKRAREDVAVTRAGNSQSQDVGAAKQKKRKKNKHDPTS